MADAVLFVLSLYPFRLHPDFQVREARTVRHSHDALPSYSTAISTEYHTASPCPAIYHKCSADASCEMASSKHSEILISFTCSYESCVPVRSTVEGLSRSANHDFSAEQENEC